MPPAYALPIVIATSKLLVELETVKARLEIPPADTSQDAALLELIAAASSAFVYSPDGLGREPWRQTYRERTWSEGTAFLFPRNWPLESIALVAQGFPDPIAIDAASYEIAGDRRDRIWRRDHWPASGVPPPAYAVTIPELDVLLEYTAGWLMPGETAPVGAPDAAWLPKELELAALATVCDWQAQADLPPAGIQSESVAGASISYTAGTFEGRFGIPQSAQRILAGWR